MGTMMQRLWRRKKVASQPSQFVAEVMPPRYSHRTRWWNNREWLAKYDRYLLPDAFTGEHHHRILDRRFTIQQLAASVRDIEGSTSECGVFKGVSSALICATLRNTYRDGALHFGFDSFEGLPAPGPRDADWKKGELTTGLEATRQHLSEFDFCKLRVGWIPETFQGLENEKFRLVHIDVDLEEPTRQSIEFFYPRSVQGAVFIFDDHGLISCPGARKAVEEFMHDKPETVVDLTTGQGFFFKK